MNTSYIESKEYKGRTIFIYYDECYEYSDCDHLGTFYTNTPRNLNPDGHDIDEILVEDGKGGQRIADGYIYVKVYAYIHSGIALSCSRGGCFSDPWDSGLGGIMAVSNEKAKKEYGYKIVSKSLRERVLKTLRAEVEELNDVCQGRVYGFVIEDEEGNQEGSCFGFVGDMDEVYKEAMGDIDWTVKHEQEEAMRAAQKAFVGAFNEAMSTCEDNCMK